MLESNGKHTTFKMFLRGHYSHTETKHTTQKGDFWPISSISIEEKLNNQY